MALMLGPVITFSWAATALFVYLVFQTSLPTAMIIELVFFLQISYLLQVFWRSHALVIGFPLRRM